MALIHHNVRDSMAAMATTEIRHTACSLDCFDACGIVAEVADGRIVRIGGDPEHPITRGALCNKVNHYLRDRFYHPDRQLHPLRKMNGRWQRLAWADALDLIAEKLIGTKERHGTLSVLYHKGNGSFAGLKIMGERFFNLYGGVTQAVGKAILLRGETIVSGAVIEPRPSSSRDGRSRRYLVGFGSVVRKHRKAKSLSQEMLAEMADIHHTHVGLIERGDRNPSLDVAHRVARALGLTLSAMIAEAEKCRR